MNEQTNVDKQHNTTLIFVTESFPYGVGEQFIETEIRIAAAFFRRILIVPKTVNDQTRSIPDNASVVHWDCIGGSWVRRMKAVQIFFLGIFWSELIRLCFRKFSLYSFRKLLRFTYQALCLKHIILKIRVENTGIYYSYWLWSQAMALALIVRSGKKGLFVSRAHGYDVYEDQHPDRYLPYRRFIFRHMHDVFFVSKNGLDHTKENYPSQKTEFHIARLGVPEQTALPEDPGRPVTHIVSCSALIPLKQIDFIIRGIALAASETGARFHWTHIGEGELKVELMQLAKELGVESDFMGSLPNEEVIGFYREHPVDLFINASYSEGVPVSIMEAQSFGIPVIAPAIGGIPEIVSDKNGALIDPPVTPEKIKRMICEYVYHPELWKEKKRRSVEVWNEQMNAGRNYQSFFRKILDHYNRKYPG